MADAAEAKSFLYAWLGKTSNVVPNYNIRAAGMKTRQRFICELNVEGFPYVGCGNSTSKKDAQTNAAKDFLQFLLRTGRLQNSEIPDTVLALNALVCIVYQARTDVSLSRDENDLNNVIMRCGKLRQFETVLLLEINKRLTSPKILK